MMGMSSGTLCILVKIFMRAKIASCIHLGVLKKRLISFTLSKLMAYLGWRGLLIACSPQYIM